MIIVCVENHIYGKRRKFHCPIKVKLNEKCDEKIGFSIQIWFKSSLDFQLLIKNGKIFK